MRALLTITFAFLFLHLAAQKPYPAPQAKLPSAIWFDDDTFSSRDKEDGIANEAFELFVNEDNNHFKQLIDSVADGWKAKKLTHLVIKWNVDPEAEDDVKKEVIQRVMTELSRLSLLHHYSNLKSITFAVGDGLFITRADNMDYFEEKSQKKNLLRASEFLRPVLSKLPFKLEVYAEIWGW